MEKLKNSGVEIGKIYDRLEVIEFLSRNKNGRSVWLCKCECGNTTQVTGPALRRGHTRSCGCLRKDSSKSRWIGNKHNRRDNETVFWTAYSRNYRNGAKLRSISFELSMEEVKSIATQPCFYCDALPGPSLAAASHYESSTKIQNIQFHQHLYEERILSANGIDRIHNHLGYTTTNCVPCCRTCNRIKSAMSLDTFAKRMRRMAEKAEELLQSAGTCSGK